VVIRSTEAGVSLDKDGPFYGGFGYDILKITLLKRMLQPAVADGPP